VLILWERADLAISGLRRAALWAPVTDASPGVPATSVYRWSTDQVDAKERFDFWREVRAKGLFGATAELEREQRPQFSGEFSLRKIGSAGLIGLRASSYHVERSASDIASAPSDSLCICLQLGGGGWFRIRNVDDFAVAGGAFATSYSDLPYHTVPIAAEGFDLRILKVPAADIAVPRTGFHDLVPKPFGDHPSLTPLLESCFSDLTEVDDDSDPAAATALVQTLTHLTLVERGIVRPSSRMSPAFVADLLGTSVRHLHVLFEEASMSFSQTVTTSRIERSRRLLREAPTMTIAEIAFASGFDSLATFYRVFRAVQGVTPGDFRDATIREIA
jgi:AraC-like DNA-binding protein